MITSTAEADASFARSHDGDVMDRPMTRPVYRVDFEELARTGTIQVRVPDRVAMVDGSGNYCEGAVLGIKGGRLVVRPNFDSWVDCPAIYDEDETSPSSIAEIVLRVVDRLAFAMTRQAERLMIQADKLGE